MIPGNFLEDNSFMAWIIIPSHLQIETINGVCTARCLMCPFPTWTRKPQLMGVQTFIAIMNKFLPYRNQIQYLSLFGCGEPLLDKELAVKVKIAKDMGFKGIGTATNCTELSTLKSYELLEAGMDTIICGVDGVTKATHEAVRIGTNFEKVVKNILGFIKMRPAFGKTKMIVRFIRQKANAHEWPEFKAFWTERLNPEYGDSVVAYDIVDYDGKVADYSSKTTLADVEVPRECEEISKRITVFSDGGIQLCCADHNGKFNLGSALTGDPITIYSTGLFAHYRRMIGEGRIEELELCNTCTIPRSFKLKDKIK